MAITASSRAAAGANSGPHDFSRQMRIRPIADATGVRLWHLLAIEAGREPIVGDDVESVFGRRSPGRARLAARWLPISR